MAAPVATPAFTDIHCHLLPCLDDGAESWAEAVAMARMALADGTDTIVATPHQLGAYGGNTGDRIRQVTRQLSAQLEQHQVPLRVLPGADVRVEAELVRQLRRGSVLTLGDHGKHVLLELPHELYFPLSPILRQLEQCGLRGILSHPERNQGLLARPHTIPGLISDGCLMQITAGSILGSFGQASQQLSEWMIQRGLVHFVASDGHKASTRRPLLRRAFERVAGMVGVDGAEQLFCDNPAAVAEGRDVAGRPRRSRLGRVRAWFGRAAA
jgi:protein-tyrosine phosphatase